MSVWCTRWTIAADDFPDDGPGPLVYRGSHIIPRAGGERGGSVDTAHLPGFITRDGHDDGTPNDEARPWWPYLRLSLRSAEMTDDRWVEDTVILDLAQVDALIADLTAWRAGVNEELT